MSNLLLPDIAGSFQRGFHTGQGQQANRLLGMGLNGDQNALAQAATIDPVDAMRVQQFQAAQQADQTQMAQAQQAAAMKKIGGAARYMITALQTKDPAQIEGAYQAVRPYLAELGQAQGKVPPAQWDPSMEQAVYQAAAMTAQAFPDDGKLYNLAPGGQLVNGTGATIASAPFKPTPPVVNNGYQLTLGPNGQYTAAQIPIGAQNGMGVDQAGAGAPAGAQKVSFNFAPGTPPEVIAAAKAEAQANGDLSPTAQTQTLAQAIAAQKSAQRATDAGALTEDAQQMLAAAGAQGYKIPIPAFGMRNSAARVDYLNDLASKSKPEDGNWSSAVQKMVFGETGITGAKAAQRQYGQAKANASAVEAQTPILLDLSSKVDRSNVPIFNKWVMAGRVAVSDDPDVRALNNAVAEYVEEYAKVMSGSPTGAATDRAANQAHALLYSADSPQAFQKVINVMHQMMEARLQGQLEGVRGVVGGLSSNGAAAQPPGAPAVGSVEQGYRFKGGDPSNPQNWESVQ